MAYNPMGLSPKQRRYRSAIDRFIPENTPLGRGDEVSMLLRATGGNYRGAAALAAIARKESSFGGSAFVPNNYWGYGIHAGPSVNRAPSVEAMAARVWKSLSDTGPSGLYAAKGLNTLPAILNKYAPPSENNTQLYQQQTGGWMKEMGFAPNVNLFSNSPSVTTPPSIPSVPQGPQMPGQNFPALDFGKLNKLHSKNQADILAGRTPDPKRLQQLLALIQKSLPTAGPGGTITSKGVEQTTAPAMQQGQFQGTYGFGAGGVDSGKVVAGGAGGDWGGSMPRSLALARAVGATPSSQKRSIQRTASGGISDHWKGSTTSYATDLPTSGAAGDKLFRKVMAYLGQLSGNPQLSKVSSGTWRNFNIGGYRYQVGWRVPGHYDHVHVGVKRIGT